MTQTASSPTSKADSPVAPVAQTAVMPEEATGLVIVSDREEVLPPQSVLELAAQVTEADVAEIVDYRWEVLQPAGSQSRFLPSAAVPNPSFEANVAGDYEFRLEARDAEGRQFRSSWKLLVEAPPGLHIELLWDTPGDADQSDEGPGLGADLDLHFLHPNAGNGDPSLGWFDNLFDIYWYNPAPDWDAFGTDQDSDPSLDRDDTDGAGPENLNLPAPAGDQAYTLGVHTWSTHGFGPSEATVRVYLDGELLFERGGVTLDEFDLWEVGTIDPATGTVTPLETPDGEPVIYEVDPMFQSGP